jgi:hypothetical protein
MAMVAFAAAAGLASCADDGNGVGEPTASRTIDTANPVLTETSGVDPLADPESFVGQRVEVIGTVGQVFAPYAFTLVRRTPGDPRPQTTGSATEREQADPPGLLVLSADPDVTVVEGVTATVMGTVRDVAEAARAAQELRVDLPQSLLAEVDTSHLLVAEELRVASATTGTATVTMTSPPRTSGTTAGS